MPDELWDTLTFPQYFLMTKYWETYPPQHVLLAAYVGYKKPTDTSFGDLFEIFGVHKPSEVS